METQVTGIDYLFVGIILLAGFFCLRALVDNISFLRDELKVPEFLKSSQMPGKGRSFAFMVLWAVMTAIFAGTAVILFFRPGRVIAGPYAPNMYGWIAGIVMLIAAVACAMLLYRYFLLWNRFRR
ncbi:MAG: hypothetical protein ACQERN_07315 [Thermodesulfobacteriota bacterium]